MRKIAVLNQKGGVGKTTTVVNIASALAENGKKVLLADLDPQAHLTIHFGLDAESSPSGIYSLLTGDVDIHQAITQARPNLDVVGAGIDLVGAETELVTEVGRETILRNALVSIQDQYDVFLVDCPPSLGLLTLNALAFVEEILIPIQPHFLALQGFGRLLQTIQLIQQRINPALHVQAILMCMYDSRTSLSSEVKADIEQFLESARQSDKPWSNARIIPYHVRRNIKLAEAPSHGKTIFEYEPTCHGAMDYKAVAEFLFSDLRRDFSDAEPKTEPVAENNENAIPSGNEENQHRADPSSNHQENPTPIHTEQNPMN